MNAVKRIKQVIVMRHDLKMRRGKQIAQGAHASMSFICRRLQEKGSVSFDDLTEAQRAWLTGSARRVEIGDSELFPAKALLRKSNGNR